MTFCVFCANMCCSKLKKLWAINVGKCIIKSIQHITIEPVFFLFALCLGIHLIVVEELYISKVCNVNLNYTRAVCDNITVSSIQFEIFNKLKKIYSIVSIPVLFHFILSNLESWKCAKWSTKVCCNSKGKKSSSPGNSSCNFNSVCWTLVRSKWSKTFNGPIYAWIHHFQHRLSYQSLLFLQIKSGVSTIWMFTRCDGRQARVLSSSLCIHSWCFETKDAIEEIGLSRWRLPNWILHREHSLWNYQVKTRILLQFWICHTYRLIVNFILHLFC